MFLGILRNSKPNLCKTKFDFNLFKKHSMVLSKKEITFLCLQNEVRQFPICYLKNCSIKKLVGDKFLDLLQNKHAPRVTR